MSDVSVEMMEAEKPLRFELQPESGMMETMRNYYSAFMESRARLDLSYPGTVEDVSKEVQRSVYLTNSMFSGLRADLAKSFSASPVLFTTAHAFSVGSQGLPPYTFLSNFGTAKVSGRQCMATKCFAWLISSSCSCKEFLTMRGSWRHESTTDGQTHSSRERTHN